MGSTLMGSTLMGSTHIIVEVWLRTNEVDTNGAAAKVMNFDRLGEERKYYATEIYTPPPISVYSV